MFKMIDKNKIIRILALVKKEFLTIFKDPQSRMLIVLPPILQLFVFGSAITLEVKNIDLSILDYSSDYHSREITSKFYSSKWFKKVRYCKTREELTNNINLKKSDAGIIIQNDLSKNINARKTTDILVILDGRQTNSASIILGYINQIISDYNNELFEKMNIKTPSINIVIRNWYNPNIEYKWFLLVSLIVMLALVLSLLLSALSIARERELGTFNQLLVSPLSGDEILLGKTIPPLIVAFLSSIVITLLVVFFFRVPFLGNIFLFLIAVFVSLFSLIGVGLFISSFSYTQQQAILGVFAFQTPSILLSGFVSPVEDMPLFFQYISAINPARYFMLIIKGIYFKNMDTTTVFLNIIPLIIIGILGLLIARWSFRKQVS